MATLSNAFYSTERYATGFTDPRQVYLGSTSTCATNFYVGAPTTATVVSYVPTVTATTAPVIPAITPNEKYLLEHITALEKRIAELEQKLAPKHAQPVRVNGENPNLLSKLYTPHPF